MIDAKQHISEVRRTLGDRVVEAGEARVLTISQVYDTDIDDLWDVVTSAERIPRWFLPISGDLKEGGHYQFEGNAGGTITRCDRPRSYAATWEMHGMTSWVEVTLTPEGDGTRFQLDHIAQVGDDMWDQYGPGAAGVGWDSGLWGLANHLDDPDTAMNPENAAAWLASDDGKQFLRMAGDAWAEADIAYGTAPQDARARADTTYAAYTGAA
jgi:uncharacterized protein YndB with AHSA1/START domain